MENMKYYRYRLIDNLLPSPVQLCLKKKKKILSVRSVRLHDDDIIVGGLQRRGADSNCNEILRVHVRAKIPFSLLRLLK